MAFAALRATALVHLLWSRQPAIPGEADLPRDHQTRCPEIYSAGLASCMAASPSAPQDMCTCQPTPEGTILPCSLRLQIPPSLDTHAHIDVFPYMRPCNRVKSA